LPPRLRRQQHKFIVQQLKAVYKTLDALKDAGESASAEMVEGAFSGGVAVARKQLKAAGISLAAEMSAGDESILFAARRSPGRRDNDVGPNHGRHLLPKRWSAPAKHRALLPS